MSRSPGSETVVILPPRGWQAPDLRELWRYRDLVALLALRDVQIRYKQSLLGVAWAVLQPLATMLVFGLLFRGLLGAGRMPTLEGVPYAVSTFCALVPWQLFARGLAASGESLVTNQALVTKVYFPRLAAPLAPLLAALVDFGCAFAVLLVMMAGFGVVPGMGLLALPGFVLLALAAALAVSLWLSALNALFRDVRHVLPFLTQLWMFVTPVVYTSDSLLAGRPEWLRVAFGLNPMTGVVEGFRWALLAAPAPDWTLIATSTVATALLLAGGLVFFGRMERSFADRI